MLALVKAVVAYLKPKQDIPNGTLCKLNQDQSHQLVNKLITGRMLIQLIFVLGLMTALVIWSLKL